MGYAPLLGRWIPWIWSRVKPQKHSAIWRNWVECGAYSNFDVHNIARWNGMPAYMYKELKPACKDGSMPKYKRVKTSGKGALNGPNSLYHLSMIMDLRQVNWMERQYVTLDIPRSNGDLSTSHTQSVDEACPNEPHRSKYEISWPQGGLTTRTVM